VKTLKAWLCKHGRHRFGEEKPYESPSVLPITTDNLPTHKICKWCGFEKIYLAPGTYRVTGDFKAKIDPENLRIPT